MARGADFWFALHNSVALGKHWVAVGTRARAQSEPLVFSLSTPPPLEQHIDAIRRMHARPDLARDAQGKRMVVGTRARAQSTPPLSSLSSRPPLEHAHPIRFLQARPDLVRDVDSPCTGHPRARTPDRRFRPPAPAEQGPPARRRVHARHRQLAAVAAVAVGHDEGGGGGVDGERGGGGGRAAERGVADEAPLED